MRSAVEFRQAGAVELVERGELQCHAPLLARHHERAGAHPDRIAGERAFLQHRQVETREQQRQGRVRRLRVQTHGARIGHVDLRDFLQLCAQIGGGGRGRDLLDRPRDVGGRYLVAVVEDRVAETKDPGAIGRVARPALRQLGAQLAVRSVAEQAAMHHQLRRRRGRAGIGERCEGRRIAGETIDQLAGGGAGGAAQQWGGGAGGKQGAAGEGHCGVSLPSLMSLCSPSPRGRGRSHPSSAP